MFMPPYHHTMLSPEAVLSILATLHSAEENGAVDLLPSQESAHDPNSVHHGRANELTQQ